MTIAEEITALRQRISEAYDVIDQKGGDVPLERTSWNLSASIESIRTGGGEEGIVPIRYLESDGNQYMSTGKGLTNYSNTRPIIDMKGEFIYSENNPGAMSMYGALRRNSSGTYTHTYQWQFNSTQDRYLFQFPQSTYLTSTGIEYVPHEVHINGQPNCWRLFDLSAVTYATPADKSVSPDVHLFGVSHDDNGTMGHVNAGACRIYRFQHKQSNVMMTDMIPVRIGTTGYMFNRATGKLHSNLGTGDFILGPDIDFTIPGAQRVEYLQFTGTQWIDTGIHGTQDTYVEIDYVPTPSQSPSIVLGYRKDNSSAGQNISIMQTATNTILDFGGTSTSTRFQVPTTSLPTGIRRVATNCRGNRTLAPTYMAYSYTYQSNGIYTEGNFTQEGTMWLGKGGDGYSTSGLNELFQGYVYHLEIHEKGVIVMDLWPCSRNGVGMFYDLITGNFFENQGTGDFTLGPDVG